MTGSPYELLKEAADRCQWSDGDQVAILLEYIEKQDSDEAFGDYLEECIQAEQDQKEVGMRP